MKEYRQGGLEKNGELSYENLVFKYLRRSGHIEKLFDELNKSIDSTTIGAYSTFDGSPLSQGLFQWSLWDISEEDLVYKEKWQKLKQEIMGKK